MAQDAAERPRIAVIGAGPAGLAAAEAAALSGAAVTVFDRMAAPARKFLLAGRGGLNLTHSEPPERFLARYADADPRLLDAIGTVPPEAVARWCDGLGQPVFTGSSGRVFPVAMKASPLLRAWLARLAAPRRAGRWTGARACRTGRAPLPRPLDRSLPMPDRALILTLSCPNRPGIVAAVAHFVLGQGGDIREAQQYEDDATGRFFMRVVFRAAPGTALPTTEALNAAFATLAADYRMAFTLRDGTTPRKVLILVSKPDHCLADLLYRRRIGELTMDLVGIASNHSAETFAHHDLQGAPFHHLPITPDTKLEQEHALWHLIRDSGAELVVLARYMQILSGGLAAKLAGRCINIHHSFLPGFKGAKPYHQAHERGVKLIGATAHYVTGDLDEGPIIEQDVERVTHADSPETLVRKGRDIERRVLARAVAWHLEDRVLLNGRKTVVFT